MLVNLVCFGAGLLCGLVLMLMLTIAIGRADISPIVGNRK